MAKAAITIDDPSFPHGTPGGVVRGCKTVEQCPGNDAGISCREALRTYQRDYARDRADKSALATDGEAATATAEPAAGEDDSAALGEGGTSEAAVVPDQPVAGPVPAATPLARAEGAWATSPAVPRPPTAVVAGRTSSIGATRRLQGLVFMGYTPVALAQSTQLSVDSIWWLLISPPATIQDVNHRIIRDKFLRLREQPLDPKPDTVDSREVMRAKELAAEMHWASPFSWDDIDLADSGHEYGKGPVVRERDAAVKRVAELEAETEKLRHELSIALSAEKVIIGDDYGTERPTMAEASSGAGGRLDEYQLLKQKLKVGGDEIIRLLGTIRAQQERLEAAEVEASRSNRAIAELTAELYGQTDAWAESITGDQMHPSQESVTAAPDVQEERPFLDRSDWVAGRLFAVAPPVAVQGGLSFVVDPTPAGGMRISLTGATDASGSPLAIRVDARLGDVAVTVGSN